MVLASASGVEELRAMVKAESARAVLRRLTASQHTHLEATLPLAGALSKSEYVAILRRWRPLYHHIETAVIPYVPWLDSLGLQWGTRSKVPLLDADLMWLGANTQGSLRGASLPVVNSRGAALGCLYVTEGATLGGQYLRQHLQTQLGLTPEGGATFFASYGPRVGSMWRAFCAILEAGLREPSDLEAAVQSAQATFTAFAEA